MIGKFVLVAAVLASGPVLSQSVKIGDGTFTVLSQENVEHNTLKEVKMRYSSESGSANVMVMLYCDMKKAEYYDAQDNLTEVKIRPENKNKSDATHMWYRFCK